MRDSISLFSSTTGGDSGGGGAETLAPFPPLTTWLLYVEVEAQRDETEYRL